MNGVLPKRAPVRAVANTPRSGPWSAVHRCVDPGKEKRRHGGHGLESIVGVRAVRGFRFRRSQRYFDDELDQEFASGLSRAFYPMATMCQIDPNVLISSPVACVVFFDARSGVK